MVHLCDGISRGELFKALSTLDQFPQLVSLIEKTEADLRAIALGRVA